MRSNLTIYTSKLALEKNTWIGNGSEYCEVLNVTGERKRQKCNTFLHYSCKLFSGRSRNAPIRNEVGLYSKLSGVFFFKRSISIHIHTIHICFYCIHLHIQDIQQNASRTMYIKKANKQNQKGINNNYIDLAKPL